MSRHQFAKFAATFSVVALLFLVGACGSATQGTYTDAAGSVLLELRSGGEASLTFMGDVVACTYKVDGNKIVLTCKQPAGRMQLTIHDDGSITGPPGSFFPALRKTK